MKTKPSPKHAPAAALWIVLAALVGCAGTDSDEPDQQEPAAAAGERSGRAPAESAAQGETDEQSSSQDDPADDPKADGAGAPGAPDDGTGDEPNGPGAAPGSPASAANNSGFVVYPDLRGGCSIDSGFEDDHACIAPPAPGEGMQIHIGPKNYDDPAEVAKYLMHPGEESSQCWIYRTPNEEDVLYQTYVLSGRAGTHHILGSMLAGEVETDAGFGRCAGGGGSEEDEPQIENLGPMPMATKPYMPRGQVAPENRNIAHRIPANVIAQADMHYYNLTERDILREIWINVYFVPPEQVTGEMLRVRGMGGFGWSREPIEPGTDNVYQYECPIVGNGRILSLLGHYHAHGRRFTASLKRKSGSIEKIFEMFDYRDPAGFEYDSVTMNPPLTASTAGALSGILEVSDGDVLAWECHIVNDSDVALRYVNEVNTGEMCNLWGQSHGIEEWNCLKN